MELQNIARVGALIGAGLSTEEISGLESSMLLRKLQENLTGKMFFWGKVNGSTQDYLVVYNVDPFGEFPDKKYYFWYVKCTLNLNTLFLSGARERERAGEGGCRILYYYLLLLLYIYVCIHQL